MEITNFTSSPDGYGLKDQSVILSCQFSPVLDPQYTTIEWYRDSQLLATTASDENYTIASFQVDHSGNYSCSVLVTVGDVVLGGAHSVEKTVRLAGKFVHTVSYHQYLNYLYYQMGFVLLLLFLLSKLWQKGSIQEHKSLMHTTTKTRQTFQKVLN